MAMLDFELDKRPHLQHANYVGTCVEFFAVYVEEVRAVHLVSQISATKCSVLLWVITRKCVM
jgi:hypothetical protein